MNPELRKQSREDKLKDFKPDENGLHDHGVFGLPFTPEESEIVLLPAVWEVTVSYKEGTAKGPDAILRASHQIDLHDEIYPDGWKKGIAMLPVKDTWVVANRDFRAKSKLYLQEYTSEPHISPQAGENLRMINEACEILNKAMHRETKTLLEQGKMVGVVGGEHSVPLGFMQALADKYEDFGILQIDAHADLRASYEGFKYSHASIMYNAQLIPQVSSLVQVGIRDFSAEEAKRVEDSEGRIVLFTDPELKKMQYNGRPWSEICDMVIGNLPDHVYISFDIDGLQPWLCPGTGTPVPGGLLLEEATYLLEKLVLSGKKIIGFDLCEVAPENSEEEWNGNVGSRVLYKLCLLMARSNGH